MLSHHGPWHWIWPERLQLTFASTFHRPGREDLEGKEHREEDEAVGFHSDGRWGGDGQCLPFPLYLPGKVCSLQKSPGPSHCS